MRSARVSSILVGCALVGVVAFWFFEHGSSQDEPRVENSGAENHRSADAEPESLVARTSRASDTERREGGAGLDDAGQQSSQSVAIRNGSIDHVGDSRHGAEGETLSEDRIRSEAVSAEGVSANKKQPFKISSTIVEQCTSHPEPSREFCDNVFALVSEMNQEERDDEWAPETETRIRSAVVSRAGGFSVRRLECRTSLCAIEIVAPEGSPFGVLHYQEMKSVGVKDAPNFALVMENDPYKGRQQILLKVFTRLIQ